MFFSKLFAVNQTVVKQLSRDTNLLFLLHNTSNKSCKTDYKVVFCSPLFSYIESFSDGQGENVTFNLRPKNQVGFHILAETFSEFDRSVLHTGQRVGNLSYL